MHVCFSVGARKTPPVLLILVGVCGCGLPSDDQLAYLLGLVKPDGVQVRWVSGTAPTDCADCLRNGIVKNFFLKFHSLLGRLISS